MKQKRSDQEWQALLDADRTHAPDLEEYETTHWVAYSALYEILDTRPNYAVPDALVEHVMAQIETSNDGFLWFEGIIVPVLWLGVALGGTVIFWQHSTELVPGFSPLELLGTLNAQIWLPALLLLCGIMLLDLLVPVHRVFLRNRTVE